MEFVDYLTTKELSEKLRLDGSTLARWRETGKGPPYYEIGGSIRYKAIDIDQWLERCKKDTFVEALSGK